MSEAPSALQQQAAQQAISEALRELSLVSDEARFQIHLFSLEAKRRWNEIEGKLRHLEARITEGMDEPGARSELTRAIRDLLQANENAAPTMPVRHLMKDAPATCRPDQTLNDAAALMVQSNCAALPVVDENGLLVGLLSERDICLGAYASGAALSETPVATAMRREVVSVSADTSIGVATEMMRLHKLDELPITTEGGRAVGMLSLRELARKLDSNTQPDVDPAWLAATVVNVYAR